MNKRHSPPLLAAVAALLVLCACGKGGGENRPAAAAADAPVNTYPNTVDPYARTGIANGPVPAQGMAQDAFPQNPGGYPGVPAGRVGAAQGYPQAAAMPNAYPQTGQPLAQAGDAYAGTLPAGGDARMPQGMGDYPGAGNPPMTSNAQPPQDGPSAWQGASPQQVQAMSPEQQAAFYQRAEAERSRVHEEVMRQIREEEAGKE